MFVNFAIRFCAISDVNLTNDLKTVKRKSSLVKKTSNGFKKFKFTNESHLQFKKIHESTNEPSSDASSADVLMSEKLLQAAIDSILLKEPDVSETETSQVFFYGFPREVEKKNEDIISSPENIKEFKEIHESNEPSSDASGADVFMPEKLLQAAIGK
ncbi:Hypothetical protein CINCED_3A003571 [Cinara cedri]|uniref:Uncharacterized protein n=1 Tax=Cinara cedri TaxID=506608 RepID=A0A5E4MS95_9HEMI|nr:Hypothetical protein CINCED_3A003571 [Cinara cedri]